MSIETQSGIKSKFVDEFWKLIDDSEQIKRMYNETKNVMISLGEMQFIYYQSDRGRSIRILNEDTTYAAVLWDKRREKAGRANSEEGWNRFKECLYLFQKSINDGSVFLDVQKSPFPPKLHKPLTFLEEKVVEMKKSNIRLKDIQDSLAINDRKMRSILKNLRLKGINIYKVKKEKVI